MTDLSLIQNLSDRSKVTKQKDLFQALAWHCLRRCISWSDSTCSNFCLSSRSFYSFLELAWISINSNYKHIELLTPLIFNNSYSMLYNSLRSDNLSTMHILIITTSCQISCWKAIPLTYVRFQMKKKSYRLQLGMYFWASPLNTWVYRVHSCMLNHSFTHNWTRV